jgi:hypothetical protein
VAYIDKMREDIYAEYTTDRWISMTGLGRLDPYPEDSIIGPDGRETVKNNYGVLYGVYFLTMAAISRINIMPHSVYIKEVIESLRRKDCIGLFNMHPHGDVRVDQFNNQKNYVAIAGAGIWAKTNYAAEILAWGEKHKYNYNNVNPEIWDIKQEFSQSDMSFYRVMSGAHVKLVDWIICLWDLLRGAFSKEADETQFSWLKVYFLNQVDMENEWRNWSLDIVTVLWKQIKILRLGTLESIFRKIYRKDHPIVKLASLLGKDFGF